MKGFNDFIDTASGKKIRNATKTINKLEQFVKDEAKHRTSYSDDNISDWTDSIRKNVEKRNKAISDTAKLYAGAAALATAVGGGIALKKRHDKKKKDSEKEASIRCFDEFVKEAAPNLKYSTSASDLANYKVKENASNSFLGKVKNSVESTKKTSQLAKDQINRLEKMDLGQKFLNNPESFGLGKSIGKKRTYKKENLNRARQAADFVINDNNIKRMSDMTHNKAERAREEITRRANAALGKNAQNVAQAEKTLSKKIDPNALRALKFVGRHKGKFAIGTAAAVGTALMAKKLYDTKKQEKRNAVIMQQLQEQQAAQGQVQPMY